MRLGLKLLIRIFASTLYHGGARFRRGCWYSFKIILFGDLWLNIPLQRKWPLWDLGDCFHVIQRLSITNHNGITWDSLIIVVHNPIFLARHFILIQPVAASWRAYHTHKSNDKRKMRRYLSFEIQLVSWKILCLKIFVVKVSSSIIDTRNWYRWYIKTENMQVNTLMQYHICFDGTVRLVYWYTNISVLHIEKNIAWYKKNVSKYYCQYSKASHKWFYGMIQISININR